MEDARNYCRLASLTLFLSGGLLYWPHLVDVDDTSNSSCRRWSYRCAILWYVHITFRRICLRSIPNAAHTMDIFNFLHSIRRLTRNMRILKIPAWLEGLHIRYTISHMRDDQAVESRSELALLWLANQLSISLNRVDALCYLWGKCETCSWSSCQRSI